MKKLLLILLLLTPQSLIAECKRVPNCNPYEKCGFLYKPVGEHTNLPTIVTLPRGGVERILALDGNRTVIGRATFRSVGVAGDAWSIRNTSASKLKRSFKRGGYIKVVRGRLCELHKIKDWCRRTDGRKDIDGNC